MRRFPRYIPGYEGLYAISPSGQVFSVRRGKILKPEVTELGYLRVVLHRPLQRKRYAVHRLVATTFIPNPANHRVVNHKDFDRSNNRVENLEWCTDQENVLHSVKAGHHNSLQLRKLTLEMREQIKQRRQAGYSIGKIAKEFGVARTTILTYLNGISYRHTFGDSSR